MKKLNFGPIFLFIMGSIVIILGAKILIEELLINQTGFSLFQDDAKNIVNRLVGGFILIFFGLLFTWPLFSTKVKDKNKEARIINLIIIIIGFILMILSIPIFQKNSLSEALDSSHFGTFGLGLFFFGIGVVKYYSNKTSNKTKNFNKKTSLILSIFLMIFGFITGYLLIKQIIDENNWLIIFWFFIPMAFFFLGLCSLIVTMFSIKKETKLLVLNIKEKTNKRILFIDQSKKKYYVYYTNNDYFKINSKYTVDLYLHGAIVGNEYDFSDIEEEDNKINAIDLEFLNIIKNSTPIQINKYNDEDFKPFI